MLTLRNLKSPGSTKKKKRIGRGEGSGWGQQAGKGHKGQKARAGGGIRTGFEGGQMPLYRRLPKRGFANEPFRKEYAVVNLGALKKLSGDTVDRTVLVEFGLLKGSNKRKPVKILGQGELEKAFTFVGIEKFSKTALEQIEKAGGKIEAAGKGE